MANLQTSDETADAGRDERDGAASGRVVVFGFDAAESSQIRRIRSLQGAGYDVVAFTMRRDNMNAEFVPEWRNIHLFRVKNERIGRRIATLVLSLVKIFRHRGELSRADVVMARNFDMLLLAFFGRIFAGRPGLPLIYECLDIHGSFTREGRSGRWFRAIERWLLKRVSLLVVSSPGFLREYFEPVQGFHGPATLMENKIWFTGERPARDGRREPVADGRPFVIGWVGSLRCEPSFRILLAAAERLGDRVRIEMHGNVHSHVVPNFHERIATRPNIRYHGPYAYPSGLASVYAGCDLVWAQDLWQAGANSDWLLPNRIYEASYFGCLSIAVAGTETARKIEAEKLGFVLPEASADALVALIENLRSEDVVRGRAALAETDPARFVYSPQDIIDVVESARSGRRHADENRRSLHA